MPTNDFLNFLGILDSPNFGGLASNWPPTDFHPVPTKAMTNEFTDITMPLLSLAWPD